MTQTELAASIATKRLRLSQWDAMPTSPMKKRARRMLSASLKELLAQQA